MATESVATAPRAADVGLKREMGLIGAMWASEGSIIGSGWLFGAYFAVLVAGTAAILSWVIAAVMLMVVALVFAELGAMYPVAGGTARFPHYAFGSIAGISFGFFSWVQALAVAPIECFAVMQYGSYYWHGLYNPVSGNVTGLGFVMTIVLMAIFTAINFLGIKLLSETNGGITWWKIAIPVIAIIVLATKFHGGNFSGGTGAASGFMPYGIKGVLTAMPAAGVVFALLGFEQADQLAGEVRNPQRTIPRAIIGAMAIGAVIYLLLQVVFIGALPHNLIDGHLGFNGIPAHSPIVAGPFAGLAGVVGLGWLAIILRLDAFISPFGTGLIYVTSTSRVSYGLARNRYYPQIFTKTDSRGVPWFSLIMAFVFGLLFLLPFPSWHALVGLITSASVLMYAGGPLALGAFRGQVPEANRPYRMPGAAVLSPLSFIFANLIIYWSGFLVVWKLGVVLAIGYILIGVSMMFDRQRPPLDWKSAQWLPVYLVGMGIISWQGQFGGGGTGNTSNIPFGLDLAIVAVFSLVIYYWAQATKLSSAEMMNLVGAQSGPEGAAEASS